MLRQELFQGNAPAGGDGAGGGGGGAFGKLAFSKLKHDPTKQDTTQSVDDSYRDDPDGLPEIETEDPIVKAEREFFEIIKQVGF